MGRMVVVIDDDEWGGQAVGDVLAEAGYEVHLVRDGRSGLAEVRAHAGCVAVVDLMLPDVDGWQVVQALQDDPVTARVPVVTCSAAMVDDPPLDTVFVRKPFTINELLAAVEEACRRAPESIVA